MKKYWIEMIGLAAAISLTACGSKTDPVTPGTSGGSQKEEAVSAADENGSEKGDIVAEQKDKEQTEEGQDDTLSKLHVILGTEKREAADPESYRTKAYVQYLTMQLPEEEAKAYPELAAAFDQMNQETEKACKEELAQLLVNYEEGGFGTEENEGYEDISLYSEVKGSVLRADSAAVSIYHAYDGYQGGAHGYYSYMAENFDSRTGKLLTLDDVVKDQERFFELVDQKLQSEYEEEYEELIPVKDYVKDLDASMNELDWSLDYEGVTMYFNPYVLGSYAAGAQIVEVFYDEAPEIFEARFMEKPDSYVIPVKDEHPAFLDVLGNGKREPVKVTWIDQGDGYAYSWRIEAGNRSVLVEDGCYDETSYIVFANGKYYLYLFEQSDNDYVLLVKADLETMQVNEEEREALRLADIQYDWKETSEGYATSMTAVGFSDPERFALEAHLELLGTHGGKRLYHVGKDGFPEPIEDTYELRGGVVETNVDLSCEVVDQDGNKVQEIVLPKGTFLNAVRTDGMTFVDYQEVEASNVEKTGDDEYYYLYTKEDVSFDENKPIYRIRVEGEDYLKTINGMEESEALKGILYAG